MNFDLMVKQSIYQHFATTGGRPDAPELAERLRVSEGEILGAYRRLAAQKALVLDEDGQSIRMALPFSGIPTQHRVEAGSRSYFANCAWDALGIPAALGEPCVVHSRCEQSQTPLRLEVAVDGPEPSPWLFHSLLPAAKWWDDIVFT